MLLVSFNLKIKHQLGKSNPANSLLKQLLRYSREMLTTREDMLPSLQKTLQLEDRGQTLAQLATYKDLSSSYVTALEQAGTPYLYNNNSNKEKQSNRDLTLVSLHSILSLQQVIRAYIKLAITYKNAYNNLLRSLVAII